MTCINNDKLSNVKSFINEFYYIPIFINEFYYIPIFINEFYYIPITFSKTILQQRKTHDLLRQ